MTWFSQKKVRAVAPPLSSLATSRDGARFFRAEWYSVLACRLARDQNIGCPPRCRFF